MELEPYHASNDSEGAELEEKVVHKWVACAIGVKSGVAWAREGKEGKEQKEWRGDYSWINRVLFSVRLLISRLTYRFTNPLKNRGRHRRCGHHSLAYLHTVINLRYTQG